MANFNRVTLIGRLTRDPETRAFTGGGMVANFGFAVTNRKKNVQTGAWEDEPMFIDVAVFNRGETGKLADLVRDRCRKGSQVFIEGRLHLEFWDDKNGGGKRSKHKIVVETLQLLDPKDAASKGDAGGYSGGGDYGGPVDNPLQDGPADQGTPPEGDIPF